MAFASDAIGLLFRITADSSDARREIATVRGVLTQFRDEVVGVTAASTTSLGRIAASTGGIGIAVAATVGAVAAAGVAITSLARSAAQAGSEIFTLSQRLNFSAETLSALQVAARLTGGSLDGVSSALSTFNRNVEAANGSSRQMSALFQRLNLDTRDNERALRQVFEILNRLTPGAQQSALAMRLFGRSGTEVLAIVKETNGNLDEAIKKYREMGLVISTQTAIAAERAGAQMEMLELQVEALKRQVGEEFIPVVIAAVRDLSAWLRENRVAIIEWSQSIASAVGWLSEWGSAIARLYAHINPLTAALAKLIELWRVFRGMTAQAAAPEAPQAFDYAGPSARARAQGGMSTGLAPRPVDRIDLPTGGGRRRGGGGGRSVESNELDIQRREEERIYRQSTEDIRRAFDQHLSNLEEFAEAQITIEEERHEALRAILQKELAAITGGGQEAANKRREINEKIATLEQEFTDRVASIYDHADRERRDAERARRESLEQVARATDDLRIQRIESAVATGNKIESDAIQEIASIRIAALDRHVELLNTELEAVQEFSAEYRRLQGEISAIEVERTRITEEGALRRTEAIVRERQAAAERGREIEESNERERLRLEGQDPLSGLSIFGPEFDQAIQENATLWEAWGAAVSGALDRVRGQVIPLGDMLAQFVSSVASGIGQMVQNFVLFGKTGPDAFRKVVASAIAEFAKMAAFNAIYYTAQGIVDLFFNPARAVADFIAAGMWAGIAGGAAFAGRAVAGNAFNPEPAKTTNSGGSPAAEPEPDRTRREERRDATPQTRRFEIVPPPGWTVREVTQNFYQNGEIRSMLKEEFG